MTNELTRQIICPNLKPLSVTSETLKGISLGAIVGTVIFGSIGAFNYAKGKKPVIGNYSSNGEYRCKLIKAIGIVATSGGVASAVETISQNHMINKFRPYVEKLEAERRSFLDDKSQRGA